MLRFTQTLVLAIALLSATRSAAAVFTVDASGGADFLTIGEAIVAARNGDEIEIASGVYPEHLVVEESLRFRGTGPQGTVVIDGSGIRQLVAIYGPYGVQFESMTFQNGYFGDAGAAIDMRFGPHVIINNCQFLSNRAENGGGALHARHPGTEVYVRDSHFAGNQSTTNGGAILAILQARMEFSVCTMFDNAAVKFGGAAACDTGAELVVDHCQVVGNRGTQVGAFLIRKARGELTSNTLYANDGKYGSIHCAEAVNTVIVRNIIAGNAAGPGMWITTTPITKSCNIYWDSAEGGLRETDYAPDEIVVDPLFCDPAGRDFTVGTGSRADKQNSPCGFWIGALGSGCSLVPTHSMSFGALKAMY